MLARSNSCSGVSASTSRVVGSGSRLARRRLRAAVGLARRGARRLRVRRRGARLGDPARHLARDDGGPRLAAALEGARRRDRIAGAELGFAAQHEAVGHPHHRRQLRPACAPSRADLAGARLQRPRPLLGGLAQVVALRRFVDQAGQRVQRRGRPLRLEVGRRRGPAAS